MTAQSQSPAGELYVHRIDELREEIRHAMAAISSNRLQAFEESLWRQEVLCTGLKHLLLTAEAHAAGTLAGSTLDTHLQASLTALYQLNRSYAELLRQAQASNQLLYMLCGDTGVYPRERAENTAQRCSLEA